MSKGSPFNDLGLLNSCDAVVIETAGRLVRLPGAADAGRGRLLGTHATRRTATGWPRRPAQYAGVFGREITDAVATTRRCCRCRTSTSTTVPADAERLITLTTCHPQFSDAQRMIIHGVLVKSYTKAAGFLPPELRES